MLPASDARACLMNIARAAVSYFLRSALEGETDSSVPFSNASIISFSKARSLFFILCTFSQMVARGFPARNDRLEELMVILFDERNEVGVAFDGNYEHKLR